METFHKTLDEAHAGEQVGVLLRGVKKDDLSRGVVIVAKDNAVVPTTQFQAKVCTNLGFLDFLIRS